MTHHEYLHELRQRLKFRGASKQRIDDIVAEVDSHLTESGEDPVDAFGPPDQYAASLLHRWWHAPRFLLAVTMLAAAGAIALNTTPAFVDGLGPAIRGERPPIELTGLQLLQLAPFILLAAVVVLPVAHARLSSSQRLLAGMLIGVFGGMLATWLGDWGFGETPVLTLSPVAALATAVGLAAVGVLAMLEPQVRRRFSLASSA